MAANSYHLTLKDYLLVARRRAGLIGALFALIFGAALAIAVLLPPIFQSTGTILVESQQIPPGLLPMTVTTYADERIQVIRQRVMTHDNLIGIVDRYGLYPPEGRSRNESATLEKLRRAIGLNPIHAGLGGGSGNTVAFEVSFQHRSPEIAQRVANELVTLFLSENARVRTERATETTRFLAQEAEKLETELAGLEKILASYKQKYANSLPEHLEMRMSMLQRAESDLRNVEREYRATEEELRFLDVELSAARAGYGVGRQGGGSYLAASLDEMKAEYIALTQRFTERHPDVRSLASRIEAFEASSIADPIEPGGAALSEAQLRIAKIQAQIGAAQSRLVSLREQEQELRVGISRIEEQIIQTPQVQRAMTNIMRDYANAREKYEEIKAKQIDARISESLEEENKAEHFSLLEPPLLPDRPVKPDREKILLAGFFLAAASSGGLVFLMGALNQKVRGTGALTQLMRQPPLAVVPYITTSDELGRRRMQLILALGMALVVVAAAAGTLHLFFAPLDLLLAKVVARLG